MYPANNTPFDRNAQAAVNIRAACIHLPRAQYNIPAEYEFFLVSNNESGTFKGEEGEKRFRIGRMQERGRACVKNRACCG